MHRTSVPVTVLALILAACSAQGNAPMPTALKATSVPVSTMPTTPIPSATTTPIPSATATPIPPQLPMLASPVLGKIVFQDENYGWGIAVNGHGYVLRTVDGGRTWLNATPSGTEAIGYSTDLFVLNSNTAWVLVPGTDFFSGTLYRTSDGGVTWQSASVPFGDGFMQFLDDYNGRLLADRGARGGSEAIELFETSDGGASWTSLFHNDPTQTGASDTLPMDGIKNGMTFMDRNTGWVTGSLPEEGNIYLYVTHDGGISWSQQSLTLPAGYAAYQYLTEAPVFFGEEGFLPLVIYLPGQTDFTFFVTQDGGRTWNGDPAEADKVIKPGLPAFGDARHIWSWDGGTDLFVTSDAAQTWQDIHATLDLSGRLNQLQFVLAPSGRFTGWALTRVDDSGHSQLYRTNDGSTWTALTP